MKDFMGVQLEVDDWVVFITPGYRDLSLGQITKFTPKKMHVSWYSRTYLSQQSKLIDPYTAVRVDGPRLTTKLLKQGK